MTIHLPEDLERYIQSEVLTGRFASEEEAITEAVRQFRQSRGMTRQAKMASEEELERQLIQSGLLASVPLRPVSTTTPRAFQPVPIKGEPLSETIIRERR